jgi:hypothetical protein
VALFIALYLIIVCGQLSEALQTLGKDAVMYFWANSIIKFVQYTGNAGLETPLECTEYILALSLALFFVIAIAIKLILTLSALIWIRSMILPKDK